MSIHNYRYCRGLRNFELRLLVLYQPYFLTCAAVVVKRQKREVKMSNYRASFPRFLKRSNSRGRQPDGAPNPIDIHVGKRLRNASAHGWAFLCLSWPKDWGFPISKSSITKTVPTGLRPVVYGIWAKFWKPALISFLKKWMKKRHLLCPADIL